MTELERVQRVSGLLRELAVRIAVDRDNARQRARDPNRSDPDWDAQVADGLHRQWQEVHQLADDLEATGWNVVDVPGRELQLVKALANELAQHLAHLELSPTARRASGMRPLAAVKLESVPTRVVAYLRVSTNRQADEGLGLDVQEAAIREWTRKNRARVAFVTRDAGRSGADDVIDRPGLAEAIGHVQAGRADAVVVARLDRVARDLILQEWIRADLIKAGGQLRSASSHEDLYLQEDPEDPTGTLVRQILGAVAQYERAMIRLRMEAGRAKKRQTGGYAGGAPPYGWRAADHQLVPNLDEQREIRRIRRWRREGKSLREIADRLNDEGVAPRRGRWHPQTVSRVLGRAS